MQSDIGRSQEPHDMWGLTPLQLEDTTSENWGAREYL